MTWETSHEAVLVDDTGQIVVSGFQDDQTLMRCRMRVGVAIGVPVGPDGTPTRPSRAAKWTTTGAAAATARAAAAKK